MTGTAWRQVAAVLALAALVAACGQLDDRWDSGEPPPPRLVDPAGVIDDWRFVPWEDLPPAPGELLEAERQDLGPLGADRDIGLLRAPEGWDVRISWMALTCQQAPEVRVHSEAGEIRALTVDPGPDVQSDPFAQPPVACPAMGVWHAVDLRTATPLAAGLLVAEVGDNAYGVMTDYALHADVPAPASHDGTAGALLVDPPDGWDVRIAWQASPCQRRPSVTLLGRPAELHDILIRPGPHLDLDGCEQAIWYALDVKTSQQPMPDLTVRLGEG
jgi:hypothetical protein